MQFIADRFVRLTRGGIVDLATGALVDVHIVSAGAAPTDRQRAARCSTRTSLWHECLPDLMDYGPIDGGLWFEAFELRRDRQARAVSARVRRAVTAFVTEVDQDVLAATDDVWAADDVSRPLIGIRLQHRTCVTRLSELLSEPIVSRPRRLTVDAQPGSGVRTFFRAAAREARRHGIVPLSTAVIQRWPSVIDELSGRHLLLLHDARENVDDAAGERLVLRLVVRAARGHMLLTTGSAAGADAVVTLDALPSHVLASAVHVFPPDALRRSFIARSAAAAGGQPGRFIALLRKSQRQGPILRVAEARSAYLPAIAPAPSIVPHSDLSPWLTRAEMARELAARGHRAAGFRALREAAAGLRRRGADEAAGRCELDTASLLFETGRVAESASLFRSINAEFGASDDVIAITAALGAAAANVLDGRLEDAEAIARAARARAGAVSPALAARASVMLARCLCWQRRDDETERVLSAVPDPAEADVRGAALCLRARLALARQDLPAASRAAHAALELCPPGAHVSITCAAQETLVVLHGRVADHAGVIAHATAALSLARAAGLRLRVVTLEVARADALCGCGRTLPAHIAARLVRIARAGVPPLMRARILATLARIHPSARDRRQFLDETIAFARATGARALLDRTSGPFSAQPAADAEAVFALAEQSPDGERLLPLMLAWVRRRLDAFGAAVYDIGGTVLCVDGAALRSPTAARVITARQPIPPWLSPEGLEAAAPVRYAGALIGIVVVRWRIDRHPDASSTTVLATVAAALGPAIREVLDRHELPESTSRECALVGASMAIHALHDTIARAGVAPFPVLIEGESGVGKELVARGMHQAGPRRLRQFCAINCAAIGDDLLESELFGHARGAFTGAHADRPGLFEQADGGTLFLDEVGELSPRAQAKLLRVLQEREVRRIGENTTRKVDVRVVAATNRALDEDVRSGRFRQDLVYRLAVVRIRVPPLRERREDIPLLVAKYWDEARERAGTHARLSPDALGALARYDWPGNVRELQNVLATLAVHAPARGRISGAQVAAVIGLAPPPEPVTLEQARARFEQEFVARTLARCGGRRGRAARELGMTRQGMAKLLKRLDLGGDLRT